MSRRSLRRIERRDRIDAGAGHLRQFLLDGASGGRRQLQTLDGRSRPRIEGAFASERMRAFDVVWGAITGRAVIENSYVDVTNGIIRDGNSTMVTDGRFSLGFPRRDAGEEINARIRVRPIFGYKWQWQLVTADGHIVNASEPYGDRDACEADAS